MSETEADDQRRYPWSRLAWAIAFAAAFTLGIYFLLELGSSGTVVASFAFLIILPAALCGFLAYVADPWNSRSHAQYLLIPLWVMLAVVVVSWLVLHEGVICILMLAPIWLLAGLAGAEIAYRTRRVPKDGTVYCSTLLALPIAALLIEPAIPLPDTIYTVTRTEVVDARPAELWSLVRDIPDVHPSEGRWNFTQDVIGVPRPISANVVGNGVGAERYALWEDRIRFREHITRWKQDRQINWTFAFDDIRGWGMTDRHLMPNSSHFQVLSGGYNLRPLTGNRTSVTLHTSYRVRTPINGYARLWGELLLGDLENNLLALIEQRAAADKRSRTAAQLPGNVVT